MFKTKLILQDELAKNTQIHHEPCREGKVVQGGEAGSDSEEGGGEMEKEKSSICAK